MSRLMKLLAVTALVFGTRANAQQADPATPHPFGDFLHSLQSMSKRTVQPGKTTSDVHSKTIDDMGLRDILPEFDPGKSNSEQFPHVAITVLRSPPMWLDNESGCWILQLVVWSDARRSRKVGPFDWCSPQDKEIVVKSGTQIPAPTLLDRETYLTGVNRTDGPQPPGVILPEDKKMQQLELANSKFPHALSAISLFSLTSLGSMFNNLRYEMGANLATDHDFRVWIVKVEQ